MQQGNAVLLSIVVAGGAAKMVGDKLQRHSGPAALAEQKAAIRVGNIGNKGKEARCLSALER